MQQVDELLHPQLELHLATSLTELGAVLIAPLQGLVALVLIRQLFLDQLRLLKDGKVTELTDLTVLREKPCRFEVALSEHVVEEDAVEFGLEVAVKVSLVRLNFLQVLRSRLQLSVELFLFTDEASVSSLELVESGNLRFEPI